MKGVKFISYVVACLALANCKVKFEDQVISVEKENYYYGDVEEVTYFLGGGLPGPNGPHFTRLKLSVAEDNKIKAFFETNKCKVNSSMDAKEYAALVETIQNADVYERQSGDPIFIDAPTETITLVEDGREQMAHLKHYYPMFGSEDAKDIKEIVEEIIDELQDDCENVVSGNIIALSYTEKNVSYPIYSGGTTVSSASSPPACTYASCVTENVTKRSFKITINDGVVRVSGSQSRAISNGVCFKNINDKVMDSSFISAINKIEIRSNVNICMAAPWGGASLQMDLHYAQGYSKSGLAGCWNEKQLINYTEFQDKFLAWLAKQPEDCAVGVY